MPTGPSTQPQNSSESRTTVVERSKPFTHDAGLDDVAENDVHDDDPDQQEQRVQRCHALLGKDQEQRRDGG